MTNAGKQLGDFLRSRRERLRPIDVGLSGTHRRRTPGLRREEVAHLAGISCEWYVKLEQGRAVAPSSATIDALAPALRLTEAEHAHLLVLALGGSEEMWEREEVAETLRHLVESLDHPAYVTGLRWDILVWNSAAAALFAGLERLAIDDRNILHFILTNPRGRILFGDHWEAEARRVVALFRGAYDRHANDPAFVRLIARVRAGCNEFDRWWTTHDVAAPVSGAKQLLHPGLGKVIYHYNTFKVNDDPKLKLAIYMLQ